MALAIYQTILFIIIGLTIWLMIKPQRIPLNLSKTTKRILLVPSCFVVMFIVLGVFHMFGWDSEQVKANQEKKEALVKQEQWEQSILDELRNDSIKIANWSPNMELDRIEFIAEVDTFRNEIRNHMKAISSNSEMREFIKTDVTAKRLDNSNIEQLHSAIKSKKLHYLNEYLKRFNSETGLSVSIEIPEKNTSRDWVILECATSTYDLSEDYIKQLSEEVGCLGVQFIHFGEIKYHKGPKRRWDKEKSYSKRVKCSNFDNNEWQ